MADRVSGNLTYVNGGGGLKAYKRIRHANVPSQGYGAIRCRVILDGGVLSSRGVALKLALPTIWRL